MKSGGRIHNIREKNAERDLLCVQPTNPDLGLHEATWMNTAFRGLGYMVEVTKFKLKTRR